MDCQNCGCYSGGTEEITERVKTVVEVEHMIRKKMQKERNRW